MKKIYLLILFVFLFSITAFTYHNYDGMMHNGFFAGGFYMYLFWIIVLAGFGMLIYQLVKSAGRNNPSADEQDNALTILQKRFAKGEIDEEEYLKRKKTLENE